MASTSFTAFKRLNIKFFLKKFMAFTSLTAFEWLFFKDFKRN